MMRKQVLVLLFVGVAAFAVLVFMFLPVESGPVWNARIIASIMSGVALGIAIWDVILYLVLRRYGHAIGVTFLGIAVTVWTMRSVDFRAFILPQWPIVLGVTLVATAMMMCFGWEPVQRMREGADAVARDS